MFDQTPEPEREEPEYGFHEAGYLNGINIAGDFLAQLGHEHEECFGCLDCKVYGATVVLIAAAIQTKDMRNPLKPDEDAILELLEMAREYMEKDPDE